MRKPLYFDGAPDLFTRTKALFSMTSRLQVRYPTPDFGTSRVAAGLHAYSANDHSVESLKEDRADDRRRVGISG